MPGTTSSVPSPNFIKIGNTGQDALGVGVTPGTQRAHIKSAVDEVTLFVEQAAASSTNNTLRVQSGNVNDPTVGVQVTGDTNNRLLITPAGKMTWGPGNATQDTNLYRSGAGTLTTDTALAAGTSISAGTTLSVGTNLTVSGSATVNKTTDVTAFLAAYTTTTNSTNAAYKFTANGAGGKFHESSVTGDTNPRYTQLADGSMSWGPGNATSDVQLSRISANVLGTTDAALRATRATSGGSAMSTRATADTANHWQMTAAGLMEWGPGNAAVDTNLFRTTTATLRTDNSMQVGANLSVTGTTTLAGITMPMSEYTPQDHGIAAWTYDPGIAVNGTTTTSGRVYLARVPLRYSATVSKVAISIASAAVTVTANQNFLGIYDSTGARIAQTAAGGIDAGIATSGVLVANLSTSPTLSAGFYWVAFVNNATTPAQIGRTSSFESTPNVNLTAANLRFAVNGAGATSLAASITPASNTSSNCITFWAAIL